MIFMSVLCTVFGLQAATVPAEAPETTPSQSPPAAADSTVGVQFGLEPPPDADYDTNEAYEAALAHRAGKLISEAGRAGAADAAMIEGVTFLLGTRCAPAMTRILLNITGPDDAKTLSDAGKQAIALLAPFAENSSASGGEDSSADPVTAYVRLLRATADVLVAIGMCHGTTVADAATTSALFDAARSVAPYLDDPRPAVANVARLLQALCYRLAGRPDRAIEVLGPSGALPSAMPFEIFARVQYCRAMMDMGAFAPTIALALRLETGTTSRVEVEHRDAAVRLFRMLRRESYLLWKKALINQGDEPSAARCSQAARRLETALVAGQEGPVRLFRLESILPAELGVLGSESN
jgi:hypothetical protein